MFKTQVFWTGVCSKHRSSGQLGVQSVRSICQVIFYALKVFESLSLFFVDNFEKYKHRNIEYFQTNSFLVQYFEFFTLSTNLHQYNFYEKAC